MTKLSYFHKIIPATVLAAFSFFGAYNSQQSSSKKLPIIQPCVAQEVPVTTIPLQEYLNQELPKIMTEHEKKFGISYVSTPSIPLDIEKALKSLEEHDARDIKGTLRTGALASYCPITNEIYLSPSLFHQKNNCACNCCYFDLTDASFNPHARVYLQKYTLKYVLHHEIAHFYTDTLSERLNKKNWPKDIFTRRISAHYYIRDMFSEGISEYFARSITDPSREDTFHDDAWPQTVEEFNDHAAFVNFRYNGGYHFVRPILEKYSAKGIEYLVQYNPQDLDFFSLPQLQKKILEDLAHQSHKDSVKKE